MATLQQRIHKLLQHGDFDPELVAAVLDISADDVHHALRDADFEPPSPGGSGSSLALPGGFSVLPVGAAVLDPQGIAVDGDLFYLTGTSGGGGDLFSVITVCGPNVCDSLQSGSFPQYWADDAQTLHLDNAHDLLVYGPHIYVTVLGNALEAPTEPSVLRFNKADGTQAGTVPFIGGLSFPYSICTDGTSLWITNGGTGDILRATLSDGTLDDTPFLSGWTDPEGIACDDTHLFVSDYTDSLIKRCLKADGSDLTTIIDDPALGPYRMDAEPGADGLLYIAGYNSGKIMRCNKDGSNYETAFDPGGGGDEGNWHSVRSVGPYMYATGRAFLTGAHWQSNRISKPLTVLLP